MDIAMLTYINCSGSTYVNLIMTKGHAIKDTQNHSHAKLYPSQCMFS